MTFVDDLMEAQEEEQSPFPNAFGVTFTPQVIGGVLAVVGLLGGAALGWYVVKPAWDNLQTLGGQINEAELKRQQLAGLQRQLEKLDTELSQIKVKQNQVLSLFALEKSFNTILLDLNDEIKNRGVLLSYTPPAKDPEIINDSSWGAPVNGMLKRQKISLKIQATFQKTQEILRSIERLQALLVVKNLRTDVTEKQQRVYQPGGLVVQGEPELTTTFDLEALLPLSKEELMGQAAAATPGAPGQPPAPPK